MGNNTPARDGETLSDEEVRQYRALFAETPELLGARMGVRLCDTVAALRAREKELETALDQINAEYDRVVALLKETTDRALAALLAELREAKDQRDEYHDERDRAADEIRALCAELAACEEDMRSLWMTLGKYRDGVREARSVVAKALNRFEGCADRAASGEDASNQQAGRARSEETE